MYSGVALTHEAKQEGRAMWSMLLVSWGAWLIGASLSGCASGPRHTVSPEPAVVAEPGLASAPATVAAPVAALPEVVVRSVSSGDQALSQGVKAYQAGQYAQAETLLKQALKGGLSVPSDVAQAHKHLAFIYCTSRRENQCAAAFKAARAADPKFALSKAEAGHPMWSQVYRRALGLK